MTTPDKEEMPTDMTAAKLIRWPDTANIGVTEANGDIVWWAQISTLNPNTSVADLRNVADRIVTACNAYEPTREALAKLLRYFGSPQGVSMAELGRDASVSLEMKVRIGDLMDAHAALSTLPVIDRQNTTDDVGILREVLEEELVWHDERDESLSKQPPTGEKGWRRAEHQERIDVIRAALKAAPQPASSEPEAHIVTSHALPVTMWGSIATAVVKRVAELPDRSSPDNWPEAMLVTSEELHRIIMSEFDNEVG